MGKYHYLVVAAFILIMSGCSDSSSPQIGPYPATEIVSEEPAAVGYIVEVMEEEQVIYVKSGITKEEAMETDRNDTGQSMHSFFSNTTTFDGELTQGDKVAVWKFEKEEGNVGAIAERIILLE